MNYLPEGETTERLIFRRISNDDFQPWMPYFEDQESTKHSNNFNGTNEEKCQTLIDTILDRYEKGNGLMALVSKESQQLIGLCGLLLQEIDGEEVIEIGYHILPVERGKGYASEAAIKCKEYAFENKLTKTLVSIIHKENSISHRVAMNNGMTLLKETIWRDNPVVVFGITA